MDVLICGAAGQLGKSLLQTVPDGVAVAAFGSSRLDITDRAQVEAMVDKLQPQLIINAAAYTAVDKAESEFESAQAVNAGGPANLAWAAAERNIKLVHVSTDFVFDGSAGKPYKTDAAPNPVSVYGSSKLAGEQAVRDQLVDSAWIVRTSWVYSCYGANFVKTMLRLMGEREQLAVVADQVGSPTWATGLAQSLWRLPQLAAAGTYHWSDAGVASWYDFAVAIQEEALALGLLLKKIPITPIASSDYPTPAKRPAYSVLDKTESYAVLGVADHWREALRKMLLELRDAQ